MNCEYCGAAISDGATECPTCGAKMTVRTETTGDGNAPAGIVCKQCGKLNPAENQICEKCGNPLRGGYLCSRCEKHFDGAINFCNVCGGKIVPLNQYYSEYSRTTFLLLTWFFGFTGVNYFYIQRRDVGKIITIISSTLLGIWWLWGFFTDRFGHTCILLLFVVAAIWFFNILFAYCIKTKDAQGKRLH